MKTFRECCQNFMPRVHKILLENIFFRNIYQILSFRTLSVNFLDVWQTFFAWFVKTAFYGFRGHFWSKNFEWKLNKLLVHKRRFLLRLLFGICASHPRIPGDGNCGCFARGFLVGLLKLNLSCPEDTIGEKRFSKYSSYSSFLDCQQKFLGLLGETSLDEKNPFNIWLRANDFQATAPEETFGGKIFLRIESFFPSVSDFQLMIIGLLAKNRKGHQKWILRVQRKFLARNYFWEKTIIIFGNAAEIAGTFNWIFCHGCQIFPPRVQKKKLLREQKLGRKEYSWLFSSLREKVSKFCKSFQQSLQNFVLPIQAINSRKIYSWNVTYLRGF